MIVTSMLLVIVGAVTLVIGIFTDQLNLVYISIGACLLAGLFLIVGIVRGRPSRKPVVTGGGEQASWSGAASSWQEGDDEALEREPAPHRAGRGVHVMTGSEDGETAADETFQPPGDEDEIVVVPKRTAGTRKAAGKKAAKKAASKKAGKKPAKKAAGKKATKRAAGKKATKKAAGRKVSKKSAKKAAKKASRQASDAKLLEGALGDVAGLGPAKRKALLKHFGSYDALRKAKPSELTEVPGVSGTLAQRIKRALR